MMNSFAFSFALFATSRLYFLKGLIKSAMLISAASSTQRAIASTPHPTGSGTGSTVMTAVTYAKYGLLSTPGKLLR